MWTLKNLVALGSFLFGSTFLWMTPAFAGQTSPPTATAWTLVIVLALVAVAGFTVAAWAVFKQHAVWPPITLASAIVGLVAVIPFVESGYGLEASHADVRAGSRR
jgi:hypothetical protein